VGAEVVQNSLSRFRLSFSSLLPTPPSGGSSTGNLQLSTALVGAGVGVEGQVEELVLEILLGGALGGGRGGRGW
jgi:hypothetical protein